MFGGNMGDLMKQAQKMQEQLQKQQEEFANKEVTGESGPAGSNTGSLSRSRPNPLVKIHTPP